MKDNSSINSRTNRRKENMVFTHIDRRFGSYTVPYIYKLNGIIPKFCSLFTHINRKFGSYTIQYIGKLHYSKILFTFDPLSYMQ